MNTLLYLVGEPGVGKSTVMAELTRRWDRRPLPPDDTAPARDILVERGPTPRLAGVELGRQRPAFSGTDALPQTVIATAVAYLASGRAAAETPLLLGEGARLANRRFLTAAADAGWRVVLAHVTNPGAAAARRRARAARLGVPEQNPSWVKGRATAATNLAGAAPGWGVTVVGVDGGDAPEVSASALHAALMAAVR